MSRVENRGSHAAAWTVAGRLSARALQLGSNLALTRLLVPEAFGLMAAAAVFLQMTQLLSDFGIQTALIQLREGSRRRFIDAAWYLSVIRALVLWAGVLALAGPAAAFYDAPELGGLLVLLSLGIPLAGFENPAYALTIRRLEARRQFLFETTVALWTAGITVFLCWRDASVTSLALGSLAGIAARTLGSYLVARPWPRPRLRPDLPALKRLAGYCSLLLVNTLVTFLAMNLDRLLLGRILSMEALGLYNIACAIALSLELLCIQIVQRSLFPLISRAQNDPVAAEGLFQKYALIFTGGAAIVQTALALGAADVVGVLYPERYAAMSVAVTALAFRGILRVQSCVQSGLLLGMRRTGLETTAMFAGLVTLAACFAGEGYLAAYYVDGLGRLSWLVCFAALPVTVLESWFLLRKLRFSLRAVLGPYALALVLVATQSLLYFAFVRDLETVWLRLPGQGVLAALLCGAGAAWVLRREPREPAGALGGVV